MVFLYEIYQQPELVGVGFVIAILWALIWKGMALWHSARNKQKKWFIALLIFNTLGLLPIIYLIWFRPKPLQLGSVKKEKTAKKRYKRKVVKKSKKK